MSEIIVAKNAGFCPGVRAATDRLAARIRARRPGERIFTLGHLIHNEQYNRMLEEQGVSAVTEGELPRLAEEATTDAPVTVFIRAHGIPLEVETLLE